MTETQKELLIEMVLNQWKSSNKRIEKVFDSITEKQFSTPIAKDSNTAGWLLCHITSVNDNLFPLLDIGDLMYPHLSSLLGKKELYPKDCITVSELKDAWVSINLKLEKSFSNMAPGQWFERHTSVSEEDFKKEPHRNKLNVLMSRTNHQAHHAGQLALIK